MPFNATTLKQPNHTALFLTTMQSYILNQCMSVCLDCVVYVCSVPLRVPGGSPSDWVIWFGLVLTWQLLIGPYYQLAGSKTLSAATVPVAANGRTCSACAWCVLKTIRFCL